MLGKIVSDEMHLSHEGRIAADCWLNIPRHFPGVELDPWVVMPTHVHGIILVGGRGEAFAIRSVNGESSLQANASPLRMVQARGTKHGSLGAIIQNFKSASSRLINRSRGVSGKSIWQRNYYERVIRDDDDLARIRTYVAENPVRWELDEENPLRGSARQAEGSHGRG